MHLQHRRYRYKKIREKLIRFVWWCMLKMNLALEILPSKKSLRFAGALLVFLSVFVLYSIRTVPPNFRYSRFMNVKPPNITSPLTKEKFLVWNEKCHIPDLDPFHKSIKHLLRAAEPLVCSRLAPLTYTSHVSGGNPVLRVDEGVASQYKTTPSRLQCCYSVVTRFSEDKNNMSKCSNFTKEKVLEAHEEYILVRCKDKKTSKTVYTNMHAVVQVRRPAPCEGCSPPPPSGHRLSVLVLGIDSMSRLNLLRTMPRTVAHLRTHHWTELRGYNKIADNTFPNLMAVLTGLNREQLTRTKCWPTKNQSLDHCPIIWREFKQKGYVTAYAEDEPDMATFNYHKGGFLAPPTDYYFRPFMLAATRRLPTKKRDGHKGCLGPTSTTEHFLRLTIDLATTFKDQLYFAVIWLNNFSHNNHNTPAAFDQRFFNFMQQLSATGALDTTLVVFLSDHGARFGKIRKTFVGWLEERLPFIYLWVPTWFQESFPEFYANLKENGDKLTSPYDLHLTLKDVLRGFENVRSDGNGTGACPSCASLFTPIPQVRGCMDAGITPHWCTCATQTGMSINEDVVKNATLFVVEEIQSKLTQAGNVSEKCAKLKLNQILEARWKVQNEKSNLFEDYIVVFETKPGLGQFDATVRHWPNRVPSKFEVMGTISRIDSYESQSACMKNADLKLYCTCKDS